MKMSWISNALCIAGIIFTFYSCKNPATSSDREESCRIRYAYSADGYNQDRDDVAGSAMTMALFERSGLGKQLVHVHFNTNFGGEPKHADQHRKSVLETAVLFGLIEEVDGEDGFFDISESPEEKQSAINHLAREIVNSSSKTPLWIFCAGGVQVPYTALSTALDEGASAEDLQSVTFISHSPANENTARKDSEIEAYRYNWKDLLQVSAYVNFIDHKSPMMNANSEGGLNPDQNSTAWNQSPRTQQEGVKAWEWLRNYGQEVEGFGFSGTEQAAFAQDVEPEGWTDTNYPDYITRVTDFGERPDWSHDGKRILFVERSFGDVYEYNLETGTYKPLTHHYYHGGYVRALYLSNGDILLSGTKDFPGEDWKEARFRLAELWVLDKDLDKPPARLGEYCWEGPAASRTQLRISWAQHHGLFPEAIRYYELYVGDLDYSTGIPKIIHQKVVLDNSQGAVKDKVLEPQNFRPGKEEELTVQAYHDCEVFGLNMQTGELINYSNEPDQYDEPEGIFPDGEYTLVECSRHNDSNSGGNIDLWKLKLEPGNPSWERLTWFNEGGVYKASNPVVSDDGRYIAFTVPGSGEVAGIGHGIYVLDLMKQNQAK